MPGPVIVSISKSADRHVLSVLADLVATGSAQICYLYCARRQSGVQWYNCSVPDLCSQCWPWCFLADEVE